MTQFNVYIPGTSCLHILLLHPCLYYYLLSPQYTVLHILFHCTFYSFFSYFYFILTYIYIYSLVSCFFFFFLHCPLSGPVLIYISLLIISCIIEYVMNKRNLNLEQGLTLDGCSLDSSSSVRNLGVLFDSNLSFDSHVSSICKTAFFHLKDILYLN